ncbi:MAG: hypothetical protein QOD58_1468 [Mycobacterium sp.]|jgi:hypothetical protein|nr:hypothetical protein [Mycobacterium sp.]
MTRFGCENGLAAADVLNGSGLSEADLHDHDRMIVGRQELTVVTNLVDLLGNEAGAAALGVRLGSSYHVGAFGIFGFPCLTSSTLGALWPNKGEPDPRPPLGSGYVRISPVAPIRPAVPASAPGALLTGRF